MSVTRRAKTDYSKSMMVCFMNAQNFCWKKKKFPEKNLKLCFRKNPANLAAGDRIQEE